MIRDEPEIFHEAIADGSIAPETKRWQVEKIAEELEKVTGEGAGGCR